MVFGALVLRYPLDTFRSVCVLSSALIINSVLHDYPFLETKSHFFRGERNLHLTCSKDSQKRIEPCSEKEAKNYRNRSEMSYFMMCVSELVSQLTELMAVYWW